MKIKKKALLYDIANMAFVIADTGDVSNHKLHRVRDICEDGNIDRVSRILGLAYADILAVLLPVISMPRLDVNRDNSATPHDYEICFRKDAAIRYSLTKERQLKIKETAHEYMVCMVLADWLAVTYPEAADVWKFRMEGAMDMLKETVAAVAGASMCGFRRKLNPF